MTPRIAIIGLAARLPGATDAHRFFDLLLQGRSGLAPLPPERWSERTYGADWPGLRPQTPQGGVLDLAPSAGGGP